MGIRFVPAILPAVLLSFGVSAADGEGKFAAKGAGRKSCEAFNQAYQSKSNEYYLYGGWIEGYVSAFNSFQKETYDITPWQTTELMMFFISKHCEKQPETRILTAVNTMLSSFAATRLTKESDLVEVNLKNSKSYFYAETLLAVREALHGQGYDVDVGETSFDEKLVKAILSYQKSKGLTQSGFPDQQTLVNLLLIPSQNTSAQ